MNTALKKQTNPRSFFAVLFLAIAVMAANPSKSAETVSDQTTDKQRPTPEQRMNARFPQPAKVSHLVGLPVLDGQDSTIGYVRDVVRTPDGKIKLILPYSPWFGWLSERTIFDRIRKPVAVPIEVVAILGSQIAALDMDRQEFDRAPIWSPTQGTSLLLDDTVRIALQRR